jgi:hypothetical protein
MESKLCLEERKLDHEEDSNSQLAGQKEKSENNRIAEILPRSNEVVILHSNNNCDSLDIKLNYYNKIDNSVPFNQAGPELPFHEDIISKGDFSKDPYTFVQEFKGAVEEHLIFIVHGMGQNSSKLQSTLKKSKNALLHLYGKKSHMLNKQIHVRIIDWKTYMQEREKELFSKLVDKNNNTKYPKMFIQQVPLDCLHYMSNRNKIEMLNYIVRQMNTYYDLVKKYRPLFKGKVSVAGHSLGSVMMYDIFTNLTYTKPLNEDSKKNFYKFAQTDISTLEEIKIDRKKREVNVKNILNFGSSKISNKKLSNFDFEINRESRDKKIKEDFENYKPMIYSKNNLICPLKFDVDHFFLLGSPLSLFLTVEHGETYLQEMETVKDFHNIIHPMDPVAYRIEHLIFGYPETKNSFTLPHWENDGIRNEALQKILTTFFTNGGGNNKSETEYLNHDKKIDRKRYDFMVQESFSEKAVTLIGFLFSHQAYWNNPDVFYFMVKMIHWQGYNHIPLSNI